MRVTTEPRSRTSGFDVYDRTCPARLVLEHVTSRWGVLALSALSERTYRFSELRKRIDGVSEKMLAQTLRTLERDGFVHREAYPQVPPRVEYSLTPRGHEAAELVTGLVTWVEDRMPAILEQHQLHDASSSRGTTA
ncbi:winged helix-turn-helix transcriptional regulator [Amycolatopsis sp. cmx-8-4]|uniref:winged helix-turn-helix transcriptional regulator n=1 Tax=Amycolatopsis sp. cmx-8-4 TaxID=2790947 RepID=UPI003978BC17